MTTFFCTFSKAAEDGKTTRAIIMVTSVTMVVSLTRFEADDIKPLIVVVLRVSESVPNPQRDALLVPLPLYLRSCPGLPANREER